MAVLTKRVSGGPHGDHSAPAQFFHRSSSPLYCAAAVCADGSFGDLVLVQSVYEDDRPWREVAALDGQLVGQRLWCRARLSTVRAKGKFAFLVLRKGFSSVQAVVTEGECGWQKEGVKWIGRLPIESVVDVEGELVKAEQATHTSQSEVELRVHRLFVVSLASPHLPFQLSDAARSAAETAAAAAAAGPKAEAAAPAAASPTAGGAAPPAEGEAKEGDKKGVEGVDTVALVEAGGGSGVVEVNGIISVGQDIRLDNRWLDLRTPANHAIFRLQSRVCQYYRQFFLDRDFVEIHTPKLTPGVSEGGAAVFKLKYFDRDACLAQSPQLYKQMCIASDLSRVFEIGPVFRAEYSNVSHTTATFTTHSTFTAAVASSDVAHHLIPPPLSLVQTHRHMCEFTGMDFEMEIKQHYHEVLQMLGDLFVFIFDQLNANCQKELQAVGAQYPFKPLRYAQQTLILPFSNAISMLQEAGEEIGPEDDFSTPQEKRLGRLVSEKYGVDFYIVDQYPLTARPFYTMPSPTNPRFTNSYDVFVRGEEITSGAQRIHDVELQVKRAKECGIPESSYRSYIEAFKFGAWPHGGAGIGLERVVMLFLGLDNIRKSALFPRTPTRYTP